VSRSAMPLLTPHRSLLLAFAVLCAAVPQISPAENSAPALTPDKPQVARSYSALPLSFERNQGQANSDVRFLSHGAAYLLSLTDNDAVITLRTKAPRPTMLIGVGPISPGHEPGSTFSTASFSMRLVNSSTTAKVDGNDPLPGTVNYFLGSDPSRWHSGIATYKRVKYSGVYPGVDLVYYGNQRQLEFDFEVAPGADPSRIAMSFASAGRLKLDRDGNLVISTGDGAVSFHKPVIYQTVSGANVSVEGAFRLNGAKIVSISLGAYDHTRPLIIDPILGYSTYIGDLDTAEAVAVDAEGNAYVTGMTLADFPTTPGAFQSGKFPKLFPTTGSVFVTKFNATGTALIYSTYIGGSNDDEALAIAIDAEGNAYVGGTTYSSDYPVTSGAFQPTNHSVGISDAFVTKLNSTGTQLVYSTYLGGSIADVVRTIAVDSSGNAYVSGTSASSDFPVTPGAFQSTNKTAESPNSTTFLTKLNSTGTGLVYSTYLGGSCLEQTNGISVDTSGFVYMAGITCSADFPSTAGAFRTSISGTNEFDTFVTKMNQTGTSLVYSTYMPGAAIAIAVDTAGNAYIAGSDNSGFPTTPGAFQAVPLGPNGAANVLVAKLNSSGTGLIYATYFGGSKTAYLGGWPNDAAVGLAVDASGNAIITGSTDSIDFPLTAGAFQTQNYIMLDSGDYGSFFAKLNNTGTTLLYSTYLSGTGPGDYNDDCIDCVRGMAHDSEGNAYLAGGVGSTDFPLSLNAYQSSTAGAFVTKFNASGMVALPLTTTTLTANANPQATATPAIITAQVKPSSGSGIPSGSVAFSANQSPWWVTTLDNTGSASYSTSTLPSGANAIAVRYFGDDNNAPSTGSMTENIDVTSGDLPTVTTLTPNANNVLYGTSISFAISVQDPSGKSVPEGTVSMQANTGQFEQAATLDGTGKTIITTDQLPVGTSQVGVIFYPSNGSYASSNATITENVMPLGVTPAPAFSVPSGTYTSTQTVTLSDTSPAADILWADEPVVGLYTVYQKPLVINGSDSIQAYAIIAGYSPSPTVSATYVIAPNGTLPTPVISPTSGSYTFAQQIDITDAVHGTDIYYTTDGTTPTLSSPAYGNAFLISTSQTIKTIAYANGYAPSAVATATYSIDVLPPDFSMTLAPTTFTLGVGETAASTLTVTPANGFMGSVSLSCSGLPAGGSCTFNPGFISTSGKSTLTLGYSGSTSNNRLPAPFPLVPVTSVVIAVALFGSRQRRPRWLSLLAVAGTLNFFLITCCGGGGGQPLPAPPTPVTSTVIVTATCGTISHSSSLTLTVN